MSSDLFTKTRKKVYDKLEKLTGVTVLDGWLEIYIEDFLHELSEYTFPALFVEYSEDQNTFQSGSTSNKCNRGLNVVGAVSVSRSENVNEKLDDLLAKLKKQLKTGDLLTDKIDISKVAFEISQDRRYAMFKADVSIDIVEKME